MSRAITIAGKQFEVTVRAQPSWRCWSWTIAAPGQLVLAGEAISAFHAFYLAWCAGQALAAYGAT